MNPPMPPPRPTREFPQVPWNFRDLLWAIAVAAMGIAVLNLTIVAAVNVLGLPLTGNGATLMIFAVLQDVIIVGAAWLFSLARYPVGWGMLGLRRFNGAMGCLMSAALFALSYVVRIGYVVTVMAFGIKLKPQDILGRLDLQGWNLLLTLLVVGILAPVAEEIFFRGFLYAGLRKRLGVLGALLISTLVFTSLHLSIDVFIPILVLGFCLAWLYEKTGSLWPGIILHASNNTLALVVLWLVQAAGISLP